MLLTPVFQTVLSPVDIWHDPYTLAWIGIAVGVFGIAVAIWAAFYQVRKQREKKEIIYQKLSEAPIVTVNTDVASRIEVLLDKKPVQNVQLLVFKVKNAGSSAVKREDYFEPLAFHFTGEVVGGEVLKTEPTDFLEPAQFTSFLALKENTMQIAPCPLNPGDAITFSVLVEGKGTVDVSGRINTGTIHEYDPVGKQARQQKRVDRLSTVLMALILVLILPTLIYVIYMYSLTGKPVITTGVLSFMPLVGFLLLFILDIVLVYRKIAARIAARKK